MEILNKTLTRIKRTLLGQSPCCGAKIIHPYGWPAKVHCDECKELV